MTAPPDRAGTGRRPTLEDVAAAAGVSRALVSIVVRGAPGASEATRARVLATAASLGYRPDSRARLLRRARSGLLGVVFGVQQPFHGDLVDGLYRAAEGSGYDLVLSATTPHRDEGRAVDTLLGDRCEALVLLGPQSPARVLAELARTLPVVAVARAVRHAAVDAIRVADDDGLRQAVDHLVGLGHERIAHVDGGRAPGAADRRRGYRTALRRSGLARHEQVIPGGLTEEDGVRATRRLLTAAPRPTAVTVFNDRCALGVLDTLARAGLRVPEDVSVVGYDDSRLARLSHVDLTSVDQDAPGLARLALERAAARVAGRTDLPRELVVPPRLVVRSTTGPPRDRPEASSVPTTTPQSPERGTADGRR